MSTEVRIYCNEPSHETKVATGDVYQRTESGGWRALQATFRKADPTLKGGAEIRRMETLDPEKWETVRWSRHRLQCNLCDLTVVVQSERLLPILDKLADNGIGEVSLHALGAIVK